MLVKLYLILNIVLVGQSCPNVCKCTGTTVDCRSRGITTLELLVNVSTTTAFLFLTLNQISTIKEGSFVGLGNLRHLVLNDNQISTIKEGSFDGLGNLQSLHLNGNQISTIKEGSFDGLGNLQSLDLSNNNISIIERHAFMNLTNFRELYLPTIKCTCNAVKELESLQKRNVTVLYKCQQQSFIKGTINTTMVDLACSGDWTKWSKTAECVEKSGQTITPYRRKCETLSGKDAKGTCIGLDTKTEQCNYNKESNPVTSSVTGKVKGRITLSKMTINGTKVTNTKLSNILNKKGMVYDELVEDTEKGLFLFHHHSNQNVTSVKIIRMSVGSLIIDYVITLKAHGKETLKDLKQPTLTNTTTIFPNSSVFYAQGSDLSISAYDECEISVDDCDANAYCIKFPDSISYACQCKDTYVGDGFKCESEDSNKKDDWILITIVSIIGVAFVALLMGMLTYYVKRMKRMRMAKKYMDVKGAAILANKQEESSV